jgi:hypothetical protein
MSFQPNVSNLAFLSVRSTFGWTVDRFLIVIVIVIDRRSQARAQPGRFPSSTVRNGLILQCAQTRACVHVQRFLFQPKHALSPHAPRCPSLHSVKATKLQNYDDDDDDDYCSGL